MSDIRRYIRLGALGRAFAAEQRHVLLIDEIDKADLEFPNDLLLELDEMRFTIPETGDEVRAKQRPVVIITSNNEKELPDAFLRRCVFHFIEFPNRELMKRIVDVHHPNLEAQLLDQVLDQVLLAARAERAAQEAVDVGARRLDRRAAPRRRRRSTSSRRTSRSWARCSRPSRTARRSTPTASAAASSRRAGATSARGTTSRRRRRPACSSTSSTGSARPASRSARRSGRR